MKAVVFAEYGSPDVLQLKEIEKPIAGDDEVLIKVHAATVTAGDCELRRFDIATLFWIPLRLYLGVRRPRGTKILGQELAGEIEAVGKDVTQFKVGDQVLAPTGLGLAAHAEYKCLPETASIVKKPANISYEEAAAVPVGGLNALHFLRLAKIRPGTRVLIYGSSGSIGTFAVQLAKLFGADVTAVCSTGKIDLVRSLGADAIIDYTREDFTKNGRTYDVIFDTIGKSPFPASLGSLTSDGYYLQANPSLRQMIRGKWISITGDRNIVFQFAGQRTEDLRFLAELLEAGKLRTVIDRCYPLEQTVEAHRYVEEGHKMGNVVITMDDDDGRQQSTEQ